MNDELEFVKRIKLGLPVAGPMVLQRRTKGLSTIRKVFLTQLAAVTGVRPDSSIVARWRLGDSANSRTVMDAKFELALHAGANAISGHFHDQWILCYPDDPDCTKEVQAEIERMCARAMKGRT